jgi:uncharacterized protein (TIGR02594 family)
MSKQIDLLNEALKYLNKGIREVPGTKSHPQILEWIKETEKRNPTDLTKDDSTYSWCGVFVGAMCLDLGWPVPTLYQRALAWSKWGNQVKFGDREPGDVVVIQRLDGGNHVTILKEPDYSVKRDVCIGGNQSNTINESVYNVSRYIAVRRLF